MEENDNKAVTPDISDEEEKVYLYQQVYISRNIDHPISLDITDIETPLPSGDYATITGSVTGHIYWTEDNKQEKVLNVHASKMVPFTLLEAEPNTENKLTLKESSYSGIVEFVGAHYTTDSFGKVIVLYMNFTNTAAESAVKLNGLNSLLNRVYISLGDEMIKNSSAFSPKELDPTALDAGSVTAYTPTGKTQLYYRTIKVPEGASPEDFIYVDVYDDNFTYTNAIDIPVAASLAEMNQ